MKKGLLTFSALLALTISTKLSAQVDTLSEFFTGTIANYGVVAPETGAVAGNNSYNDIAKMMLFDDAMGVYTGGTIDGVLVGIIKKTSAGGSFKVAIWADNNGVPGATPLGSQTLTTASVDTTLSNYNIMNDIGYYNVDVTFTTPIKIPTNRKFWAGVILPTTAGDSIQLITNSDGDFSMAKTNTGEIASNGTFGNFVDDWSSNFAMAIFPKVNFINTTGISENDIINYEIYPNPANDYLNFKLKENCKSIEIISLDGKSLIIESVTGSSTKINISNLNSGVYMFKLTNDKGLVTTSKFVKK